MCKEDEDVQQLQLDGRLYFSIYWMPLKGHFDMVINMLSFLPLTGSSWCHSFMEAKVSVGHCDFAQLCQSCFIVIFKNSVNC